MRHVQRLVQDLKATADLEHEQERRDSSTEGRYRVMHACADAIDTHERALKARATLEEMRTEIGALLGRMRGARENV